VACLLDWKKREKFLACLTMMLSLTRMSLPSSLKCVLFEQVLTALNGKGKTKRRKKKIEQEEEEESVVAWVFRSVFNHEEWTELEESSQAITVADEGGLQMLPKKEKASFFFSLSFFFSRSLFALHKGCCNGALKRLWVCHSTSRKMEQMFSFGIHDVVCL